MSNHDDLQFSLPNDDWEAATPPEGQIFMAMRKGEFQHFRPNISADAAELQPGATLEEVADDAFGRLRTFDENATIVKRGQGAGGTPTIMQRIEFDTLVAEDTTLRLAQFQFLAEVPEAGGGRRAALCFMLTAEAERIEDYADDFEAFLTSARAV